jgi:hypothetical protein
MPTLRRCALLAARSYSIVHADHRGPRGIDVAFVYDSDLFCVPANETFSHVVIRRNATRQILQVNFQTDKGRTCRPSGRQAPRPRPASSFGSPSAVFDLRGIVAELEKKEL